MKTNDGLPGHHIVNKNVIFYRHCIKLYNFFLVPIRESNMCCTKHYQLFILVKMTLMPSVFSKVWCRIKLSGSVISSLKCVDRLHVDKMLSYCTLAHWQPLRSEKTGHHLSPKCWTNLDVKSSERYFLHRLEI